MSDDLLDPELFLDPEKQERQEEELAELRKELEIEKARNADMIALLQKIRDRAILVSENLIPFFEFAAEKHGMYYRGPTMHYALIKWIEEYVESKGIEQLYAEWHEQHSDDPNEVMTMGVLVEPEKDLFWEPIQKHHQPPIVKKPQFPSNEQIKEWADIASVVEEKMKP